MTRIIAGSARGTRLQTPKGEATRPTTDRVREAVFNIIASWVSTMSAAPEAQLDGLAFCDLFAGSGGMGLEAASRGAAPVTLVESNPATAAIIEQNAATAHLAVQVRRATAAQYAATATGEPFDIVWADPPYAFGNTELTKLLTVLLERGLVASNGLLIIERATTETPFKWPGILTDHWTRSYGQTTLHFAQTGESTGQPSPDEGEPA